MTYFPRWMQYQTIRQWRPVSRRRLYYLLFGIYACVALLWLLFGLMPVAVDLFNSLGDLILLRLRQMEYSFSAEGVLLRAIRMASYEYAPLYVIAVQYLFSAANIVLGILLVRLRPWDRVAWLLAFGLIGTGAIFNAQSHVLLDLSSLPLLVNTHEILHIFSGVSYSIALLLFPTGTLPPSPFPDLHLPAWLDWPFRLLLLWTVAFFGWMMLGALHGDPASFVAFFGVLVPALGGLAQLFRYRCAMDETERQQTRTLLFTLLLGAGMAGISLMLFVPGAGLMRQPSLDQVAFVVFPLLFTSIPIALTFIVLRYRLWEINLVINRGLIYGTLTVVIAALYGVVVGGADLMLQGRWHWLASAIVVALVAILAQPLRERVQSGVNRLMYGERDDPFGVLARLGHRLEATGTAEGVLPAIAETVARALKLPYVAVAVKNAEEFTPVAAYGQFLEPLESFSLIDQGEVVGKLWVARRVPNEPFHRADQRLLENLARQAGPAVHAVLLAQALQHSRLRLVTAREEERRRLRRDLHDGLGPQLASLRLKVDAIRNNLHRDPAKSDQLLLEVKEQIGAAIVDVRRTVYGLRPPALDQLGLISAVREFVRSQGEQNGLEITVVGPETLPPLPAATEVAAYHIVLEGLTNIVHHAHARRGYVGLCLSDALHLVIADDGVGLSSHYLPGVGLVSMRERVAELGGSFTISATADMGTRIEVNLPLPAKPQSASFTSLAGDLLPVSHSKQSEIM